MRLLVVNADYPDFLARLYAARPGLAEAGYEEQLAARNEALFGTADFYSSNLRALGHEAFDIHCNNGALQAAWAREHEAFEPEPAPAAGIRGVARRARSAVARTPLRRLKPLFRPLLRRMDRNEPWRAILRRQIEHHRPDVLVNHAMDLVQGDLLREVRPHVRLIVGQHAATPFPDDPLLATYDLFLSSMPAWVDLVRRRGGRAELHRLGFERTVLDRLPPRAPRWDVTFAGSLPPSNRSRLAFVEAVAARLPALRVFAPSIPAGSTIAAGAREEPVYGIDMYRVLRASRITLNHHGDVPPFANNMRLYEATGAGALLVTDWKENLSEIFEPGREVLAYRSAEECAELCLAHLARPDEAERIARAGQARTLRDHTYRQRMEELCDLVRRML